MNRAQYRKAPGGNHRFAATPAAVAYKTDALFYMLTKLDQIVRVGLLQKIKPFVFIHPSGMAVFNQLSSNAVKGHADVKRSIAYSAQVKHFVPAVTDADSPVLCAFNDLGCALVIKNVQRVLF